MLDEVITLLALIWTVAHVLGLLGVEEYIVTGNTDRFNIFNPIRNYKRWTSMNWFGVILCTVFLHILLPVYAVVYWFYKLCTFGRKQEKR
jgi:hypothetical protein